VRDVLAVPATSQQIQAKHVVGDITARVQCVSETNKTNFEFPYIYIYMSICICISKYICTYLYVNIFVGLRFLSPAPLKAKWSVARWLGVAT